MNKFILGGILAAISLMAIYGTSASNRVTSWVDRADDTAAQSDAGLSNGDNNETVVALNDDGTTDDSNGFISSQTPLERAGDIPRRQTVGSATNFGTSTQTTNTDDTGGEVIEPNPTEGGTNATSPETPPANNQAQQRQNQNQPPVRALW